MEDSPLWEPVAQKISESIRDFMAKVTNIWDEMGSPLETKEIYLKQVFEHVEDLKSAMLGEMEERRSSLAQEVDRLMSEAVSLKKDLQIEVRVDGYENLSLYDIRTKIQHHLQRLRSVKQQRLNSTKELLKKELDICKVLGSEPIGMVTEIPSETELKSFKLYLDRIEAEKTRLEGTFKDAQNGIIDIMDELRLTPESGFESQVYNGENFVYTTVNMTKLREFHDNLKKMLINAKQEAEEKREQLQDLWKYLEEPSEKCQEFLDRNKGYTVITLKAFDDEIKRCKQKRSENIAEYVVKLRCQIEALWDQCQIGDEERRAFKPFTYQTFTEDLLILHEIEAETLRKYYEDNRVIFELLEERDNMWQQIANLEQRANDPNRYQNRGGQLLAEEKERKVIQKKLPKIEKELEGLLEDYQSKNGKPFTTHGVPLAEALKRSWAEYIAAKQTMSIARKQARDHPTTIKKTPLSVSKRTPSAMSIRRPSPANSTQRKQQGDLTPFNPSRKRGYRSSDSNKKTVSASKIKRGRVSRRIFPRGDKSVLKDNENRAISQTPSTSGTSMSGYDEFQDHLMDKEELRSSILPRTVLKSSNLQASTSTRIKTPMKPTRKHVKTLGTLRRASPNKLPSTPRSASRSPKTTSTSRLAPAPGTLPFIF
ncbi:protein regulator of cytokinesis 1 isoform X1 [Neodiprion lecontei]|uniref:Protein regulator of cytokinesis 1 isoform X1 n=3 Tax=Neodiprion lecontei TaxID=441921 RepID=A0A6J0BDZ2_NEOLC|nr:protein regulator of cytokinesis 1 isoform X1 [Neodiprion lecontei]